MEKKTCEFVPVSSLGLSEIGLEEISNCSNVTFGDAQHSLFKAIDLIRRVDFSLEEDVNKLTAAGLQTLIDVES